MKVKILGWDSIYNKKGFVNVPGIWVSPNETNAVIEWYRSELFISVRILEKTKEGYLCEFVEAYEPCYATIDARSYEVDWRFLEQGFCKLICFEVDSGFYGTERRFWFQR